MRIRLLAAIAAVCCLVGVSCSVPSAPAETTTTTTSVPGSKWVGPTSTLEGFAEVDAEASGFSTAVADVGGGAVGLLTYVDGSVGLARIAKDGTVRGPWKVPGIEQAVSMAVDSAGRYVVAALARPGGVRTPVVVRLLGDGSADPSFGQSGTTALPAGLLGTHSTGGLTIDAAGRVVVVTHPLDRVAFRDQYTRAVMWRLDVNGSVDPAFGTGGSIEMGPDTLFSNSVTFPDYLSIADTGEITAVVRTSNSSRLVRQYLPDGKGLNPAYGIGGLADLSPAGFPSGSAFPGTWLLRGAVFGPEPAPGIGGAGVTLSLSGGVDDLVTGFKGSRQFIVYIAGNGKTSPGYLTQRPTSSTVLPMGTDLSAGPGPGRYWIPSTFIRTTGRLDGGAFTPRLVSGLQTVDRFGIEQFVPDPLGTVLVQTSDGSVLANCASVGASGSATPCIPAAGPIGVRGLDGDFFLLGKAIKAGPTATASDLALQLGSATVAKIQPAVSGLL